MIDSEMHALLSAYAAGTLTKDEEKRLFEKALNNQTLFDALADEESMRAALASPLVKEQLLRTLNHIEHKHKQDPPPNRWLWVGLAASLFIGTASLYYWPAKQEVKTEQMAANAVMDKQLPEVLPESKPAPPRQRQNKPTEARTNNAPRQMAAAPPSRTEPATQQAVAPATAPPTALPVIAEPLAQPVVKAEAKANSELSDTAAKELAPSKFLATSERARAAKTIQSNSTLVAGNALHLRVASPTFAYAFLVDGETITPVKITNPIAADTPYSFNLGQHSPQGEVWVYLSPTEDPVLARAMTGVLPLPTRNWTKLKTNP